MWIWPVLPGARHDMGAACTHGIINALCAPEIDVLTDTAHQGGGPAAQTLMIVDV